VGSVEKSRIFGESNLNAIRDGFRVLRTILNERSHARRTARQAALSDAARSSQSVENAARKAA
jgi:hypothetical protein